jgi:hypothetical protein
MIMIPSLKAEDVIHEMDTVLGELGSSGAPTILHLVGLKKRHTEREDLAWHEALSMIAANGSRQTATTQSFRLPDLRNSKFLPKVQPPRERSLQSLVMSRVKENSDEHMDISSTRVLVNKLSLERMQGVRHLKLYFIKTI